MTPLGIGRIILLTLISILSAGTAGLSGYLLALLDQVVGVGYSVEFGFLGFSLACGVITVLLIAIVRILDWTMADSWLSRTAVEVGWLGVLWVLWMGSAGYTTSLIAPLDLGSCSVYYGENSTVCAQAEALQAFGWVTWLLLVTLFIWELTFAIMAHQRGYPGIWMDHAPRHVLGTKPLAAMGGGQARYMTVGTNDYGMEHMKGYDSYPHQPRYGQPGMYGQPAWGQQYTTTYGQPASYNPPQPTPPGQGSRPQSTYASTSPQPPQQQLPPQQQGQQFPIQQPGQQFPPQQQGQQQPRQAQSQGQTQSALGQPKRSPGPAGPAPQAAYAQMPQGTQGPPPGAAPAQNPYARQGGQDPYAPRQRAQDPYAQARQGGQTYYGRAEV
ncbi:hypothetical protein CALVIDRAFT_602013 [Calocera viscosa TUFC12733]|uniref:MARVEL domain-containing protein n=1 Tax=Calocera viscosa (strain TUFC12733) TaxID=1330018 RepID=A0A167HN26_CALVF|nr:hypothetical protein CALVIDRAFT_602013 [Calocera viscosa TUFC12733]